MQVLLVYGVEQAWTPEADFRKSVFACCDCFQILGRITFEDREATLSRKTIIEDMLRLLFIFLGSIFTLCLLSSISSADICRSFFGRLAVQYVYNCIQPFHSCHIQWLKSSVFETLDSSSCLRYVVQLKLNVSYCVLIDDVVATSSIRTINLDTEIFSTRVSSGMFIPNVKGRVIAK